ncbi:arsenate reductase family protein [Janthinobacterium sp. 17J80-10]|uniref:arsenate reductase family protein n=1 Tax=Janthinobacterium sp. 17J80-10 TaxID=2497863 RepID=UPI001005768E|nr:arsenate reductase family protein [Janthinobacterium sp. 17J80-10]QAU32681.1 arsenate reductase family protein [Janthinobacterium sp. 17J80-10]
MITLFHNPRCSKSREALAILENFAQVQGISLEVVDYQKTPLSLVQLTELHAQLGGAVRDMVRTNEDEYAALKLADAGDAELLAALARHPRLLQRPIAAWRGRALVARPPEQLVPWLGDAI